MAVQTLLWTLLPTVVYGGLAWLVLDDPPRVWVRARRWAVRRRAERLGLVRRHGPSRAPLAPAAAPDPFDVLAVQVRLGVLAAQLRSLEVDPRAWARGRRIIAAQAAYDALLAEACRLAGVPVDADAVLAPWGPGREPERFREELELASRGWSW
ncbi:hypothetical protein [Actinotalea sp. JY-7876]|uniref:hypothetical protein n=1 Tax=Actinotalea sp. JY-7876 TaxID=2758442 RepID=UPI00210427D2|nr:hypothetical protein [Actinotalea sp. JY-7876]